ncbi:MAG: hypothetical protein QM504_03475 [Pseudomonadota bacterium]
MKYYVIYTGDTEGNINKPKCFKCTSSHMFESTLASKNNKEYLSFLISAIVPNSIEISLIKAEAIMKAATGNEKHDGHLNIDELDRITTQIIDTAITKDINALFLRAQDNQELQQYVSEMLLRYHSSMLAQCGIPYAGFTTVDNIEIDNINAEIGFQGKYFEHDISNIFACFSREEQPDAPTTKILLDALIKNTSTL